MLYDRLALEPPRLQAWHYRELASEAWAHGLPPDSPAGALLEAEGLELLPSAGVLGVSSGDWIAVPLLSPYAGLLTQHERAHAWARRLRWPAHSEADVWIATGALALPPGASAESAGVPEWFAVAALKALAECGF